MIAVRENSEVVVVEVEGEFAEQGADEFGRVIGSLIEKNQVCVVLNLKRAKWTSLRSLKWLVGYLKRIRQQNGDLKLASPNPYLTSLLELTGTLYLFDVYPSVEDALESFRLVSSAAK